MTGVRNINVICNSLLAIPALHELIRQGRLQSIAIPAMQSDAQFYIEGMAKQLSIPIVLISKENIKEQMEDWLLKYPCKLVLCLTFPYKIPASVLTIPELGFFNFHFALLPNYRGAEPVFWQIKNRETFGGITVHKMDKNWDTGSIIFTKSIPIQPDETHGMHWSKLAIGGVSCIQEFLTLIDSNKTLSELPQKEGRYYPKPAYKDVKLDWQKSSSKELLATIKACNPWNKGAFTFLSGKEIRIVEASVVVTFYGMPCASPGSILIAPDRTSFVICCNDSLYIKPEIVYTDEGFITPFSMLKMGLTHSNSFH